MEQTDARQAAEIARFLVDMSLSLRFLTEFANIPNAHWRKLTRDELRDFNIVNTE
jgi:predicted nuclease of predicted toxin-antitoxin system